MQHLKDLSTAKKIELYTLLYEDLSSMGIEGDTELAHVNKEEMAVLRSMGGSGTVNPRTQLVQFMGGSSPPPAQGSQTVRQETTIPDELAPFVTDILEKAKATQELRAEEGYETFEGDRIADFTPEQERAFEGIAGLTGKGQEYFDKSEALTDRATAVPTSEEVGGLMSPYIQNVVDIQNREAQRAADIQQQKIDSAAVSAGGFGGSRHGIVEAEHFRNLATQKGDIQERGLAAAFEDAQTRLAQQRAREFQGASQLSNLGVTAPGQASNEFRNLEAVGAQQQSQTQRNLNLEQQDFEIGRTFPERSLQDYNAIVRGYASPIPASSQTNTQSFTPTPSFLSQAAGTGLAVAGIANAFKGGFKEGGLIGLYGGGQPQINRYAEGTGSYTIGAQPNQKPDAKSGLLNFIQNNVFPRSEQDTYDQKVARLEEQRKLEAEKRQAERQALDTARNNAIQQQPVPVQSQQAALSPQVPPQNVSKFADGTGRYTIGGKPRGYDPRNIDNIIASLKDQIQNIASRGGSPRDLAFLQEQLNTAMTTKRKEDEAVRNEEAIKRIKEVPDYPPMGNEHPSRTQDMLSSIYNQQANNKQADEKYFDAEYAIGDGAGDPNRNEQTLNALATTEGRANDILKRDNVFAQEENALSEEGSPDNRNKRALDALATTQGRANDILRREKLYDSQENAFTGDGNIENLSPDRSYKEARRNFLGRRNPIGQAREAEALSYEGDNSPSSFENPFKKLRRSVLNIKGGVGQAPVKDIIALANDINYERDKDISISGDDGTAIPEALTVADAQRRSTERQNRADASYYGNTGEVSDNSIGVGQDDQAQPLSDTNNESLEPDVLNPSDEIREAAIATNPASVNNVTNGVEPDEFNSDQLAITATTNNPRESKVITDVNILSDKAPSSSTNTAFSNQLYDKWLAETAKQKGELTEQKAELGREKWMQVAKLGFSILSQPGGQTFLQTIGSGAVKSGFVDGLSKLTAQQRKLTSKIGSLNKEDLKIAFGLDEKQWARYAKMREIDVNALKTHGKNYRNTRDYNQKVTNMNLKDWQGTDGAERFNKLYSSLTVRKNMEKRARQAGFEKGSMWGTRWFTGAKGSTKDYLETPEAKDAFKKGYTASSLTGAAHEIALNAGLKSALQRAMTSQAYVNQK